jgi:hypothetical protein
MASGSTRHGSDVAKLSLLLTLALAVPAWSQIQRPSESSPAGATCSKAVTVRT